ncbi:MAG TPA: CotH kinase family protein [Vicinamibacteria bacterium]
MRRATSLAVFGLAVLAGAPAWAADPMFNPSVLHETRIVMDPKDWQSLRDNFRTNQYYAANLAVDNEVVEQVGIRSRGHGSRSGDKPAIEVDINKYVNQTLHGYHKLVIKNLIQDPSDMREPLSFQVFEAMGIPAPQVAHTRLTVNDEYWGLYTLDEPVSKPFLRNRFGEDTGNLFKYDFVGPYRFEPKGSDPKLYIPSPFSPETNENSLDGSALVNFIRTMNEAPDATFVRDISAFIDVEKFLTYLAVENAIAENDGFLGYDGLNNFYVYQSAGTTKFTWIPWDNDNTFFGQPWPIFLRVEENVLARRLLNDPASRATYLAALKRAAPIVTGLLPKLEAMYSLIREAALADTKKQNTNDEFENSVGGLRGLISARAQDIMTQVAAVQ